MSVRMTMIKKNSNNKCWQGCGEKRSLTHCWWECKLVWPLWKTVWKFLKNLKIELPFEPAIPLQAVTIFRSIKISGTKFWSEKRWPAKNQKISFWKFFQKIFDSIILYVVFFFFLLFWDIKKNQTQAFRLFHRWLYLVWIVLPLNQSVFFTISPSMDHMAVGNEVGSLGFICQWPNEVSDRLWKRPVHWFLGKQPFRTPH